MERSRTMAAMLLGLAATPALAAEVPAPRSAPPVYGPSFPRETDPRVAASEVTAPVTTLADAIERTYWNNPSLLAQRATLRGTDYRFPAARGAFGPRIDAQGGYGYQRDRFEATSGAFSGREGFSSTATVILSQPVFTFGRNAGSQKLALAEIAFGRDSLRLAETQAVLDTIVAYVALQRDLALVAVAAENLALLQRQFDDNRERFRVREITRTDLEQVETRLGAGRAELVLAQGQLGVSRAQFVQRVGALPGELAPATPLPIPAASLGDAQSFAEANSPIVRAAQSREKISRASIELLRADFLPRVDLRGSGSYGTVSPYSDDLRTTQLRGEVVGQLPLFDSGVRNARLQEGRQANDADWRLVDQALRDTRESVSTSWERLASTRASLDGYRAAVDAARRAYEGARIQEKAGDRTTLDVLDLARDLLNVRTSYLSALSNEYLARASLLAAMGLLEAPLLVPTIAPYDPDAHFDRVKHKGDIPLLTPLLSTIDGATTGNVRRDRTIRDPAGTLRAPPTVPMPPDTGTAPIRADVAPPARDPR